MKHIATINNFSKSAKFTCTFDKKINSSAEMYESYPRDLYFCSTSCYTKYVSYKTVPYKAKNRACVKCNKVKHSIYYLDTYTLTGNYNFNLKASPVISDEMIKNHANKDVLEKYFKQDYETGVNFSIGTDKYSFYRSKVNDIRFGYTSKRSIDNNTLNICDSCFQSLGGEDTVLVKKGYNPQFGAMVSSAQFGVVSKKTIKKNFQKCTFCKEEKNIENWISLKKAKEVIVFCSEECSNLYILQKGTQNE